MSTKCKKSCIKTKKNKNISRRKSSKTKFKTDLSKKFPQKQHEKLLYKKKETANKRDDQAGDSNLIYSQV